MTLANCGQRADGVVVLELEPGFPAHRSGLLVGDIILSVGEECIVDTNVSADDLSDGLPDDLDDLLDDLPDDLLDDLPDDLPDGLPDGLL